MLDNMRSLFSSKVKIKLSLPDIKYGHLKPREDSFIIEDNIFGVADGITRDPISPVDFDNLSMKKLLKNYPRPSGAKMAADCFCKSFVDYIKSHTINNQTAVNAFKFANIEIEKLNKRYNPQIDYLVNDFYACVACGGIINKSILYWSSIGDAEIKVCDKKGNFKFESPNGVASFLKHVKINPQEWGKPKRRREIRSQFRNNPNKKKNGRLVAYGALTGEKNAEYFIYSGKVNLSKGDLIIFYTDGFSQTIKNKQFLKLINQKNVKKLLTLDKILSKQNYQKYGEERTLIIVLE